MCLTTPHANGNRGNEAGWVDIGKQIIRLWMCRPVNGFAGWQPEAETDSPDNLRCTGLFWPFSHCYVTLNIVESTSANLYIKCCSRSRSATRVNYLTFFHAMFEPRWKQTTFRCQVWVFLFFFNFLKIGWEESYLPMCLLTHQTVGYYLFLPTTYWWFSSNHSDVFAKARPMNHSAGSHVLRSHFAIQNKDFWIWKCTRCLHVFHL